MTVLPDVLAAGLHVVVCGTAAGSESARAGAYYAGPGNRFWPILARIELTPFQLAPSSYPTLPEYGIGLTDLAKQQSGEDAILRASDFDTLDLLTKIESFRPRAVAFNGKKAAQIALGRPVAYGRQPETFGGAAVFVLPSTSGAARRYWDETHWQDVARFARAS